MKNQILMPMLASREYVVLPCATAVPATDGRGLVARAAVRGTEVRGDAAQRVRITGKHTGFAHRAGSLTWSSPT